MRVGTRALLDRIDSSPLVDITQGSKVTIKLDRTMPWELDGGDQPRAKKFKISVLPGRLSVCVPSS